MKRFFNIFSNKQHIVRCNPKFMLIKYLLKQEDDNMAGITYPKTIIDKISGSKDNDDIIVGCW